MQRLKNLSALILTLAVALTTGCQSDDDVSYANYQPADKANHEYREAAKKWDLAPGATWPTEPFADRLSDGNEAYYEKGSGVVDASFDWWCSWALTLTRQQTEQERKISQDHVLRIHETPFYQRLIPQDREAFDRDVVKPALTGDFSGATMVANTNCGKH
ncbi:hypothetical protein [Micromonospora sp. WMMD737]|uniref:hypothetical protein n=1 Tax=Micromonospora sp. WMMD737 TaxID=3404113 RepID=UPI003B94A49F